MHLEMEAREAPGLRRQWLNAEALGGLIGLIALNSPSGEGPQAGRERELVLALRSMIGEGLFLEVSRLGRPG